MGPSRRHGRLRFGPVPITRRRLLVQAGRGALGIAVLGVAACASDPAEPADPALEPAGPPDELAWSRVDLGFVSAYVLVRGNEAAVVDTGEAGSADAIGDVLAQAGPGWGGVRHVVLTHRRGDHVGSIGEVQSRATNATAYAGEADLAQVGASDLRALADGDEIFGLQIVGTPGHTAGHMAVFDADTGVLVAGDALTNLAGLAGSNPQYTADEAAAVASVRKLAALAPRVILVGHGEPVVAQAAQALEDLATSLG